jgi:hypothetical protein
LDTPGDTLLTKSLATLSCTLATSARRPLIRKLRSSVDRTSIATTILGSYCIVTKRLLARDFSLTLKIEAASLDSPERISFTSNAEIPGMSGNLESKKEKMDLLLLVGSEKQMSEGVLIVMVHSVMGNARR